LVGGDVIDADDARVALTVAAIRAGLGGTETQRTIASGLEAGRQHPRQAA
jgi:hypothetical protein